MRLSVIIPAFNEERYLGQTLERIRAAADELRRSRASDSIEVIVVDNDSADRTGEVAASHGCRVVKESVHNIGKVRNTGAAAATGDVLIFVDADTLVPPSTFEWIAQELDDVSCIGGAVDVCHRPARRLIRYYLLVWRAISVVTRMAQGATQFCRAEDFRALGGYDERIFMGEDVDFYWRMRRLARRSTRRVALIDQIQVLPSPRRFDQWPVWKTLALTNPFLIMFFRSTQRAWSGWYRDRPK